MQKCYVLRFKRGFKNMQKTHFFIFFTTEKSVKNGALFTKRGYFLTHFCGFLLFKNLTLKMVKITVDPYWNDNPKKTEIVKTWCQKMTTFFKKFSGAVPEQPCKNRKIPTSGIANHPFKKLNKKCKKNIFPKSETKKWGPKIKIRLESNPYLNPC